MPLTLMQTFVYRSSVTPGLYVYLAAEDGLTQLPDPVMRQLGTPEFALSFDLTIERSLGQENPAAVLDNLQTQGFHIQMPRDIEAQLASIAATQSRSFPCA